MPQDLACLSYWYPLLQTASVPTPKTLIVRTDVDLIHLLDGETPNGFDDFMARLHKATDTIGYPCFLRTGHTSGKHQWSTTCHIVTPDDLASHVASLVEWSHCASLWGFPTDVWVIRELLDLAPAFTTSWGMPIGRERRYFIDHGEVICRHLYWPEDALKSHQPDWRTALRDLNREPDDEVRRLTALSTIVARHIPGAWSIDWVLAANGMWYAIGMAPAKVSWHWPGCLAMQQTIR